jgi:hypothetical protein
VFADFVLEQHFWGEIGECPAECGTLGFLLDLLAQAEISHLYVTVITQ